MEDKISAIMKKELIFFQMILLLFSGCGKEGNLIIPPDDIPSQITQIFSEARGENVHIMWEIPESYKEVPDSEELWKFEIDRYISKKSLSDESLSEKAKKDSFIFKIWKSFRNSIVPEKKKAKEERVTFYLNLKDVPERYKRAGIGYFIDYGEDLKDQGNWFGNTFTYSVQGINKRKKKSEEPPKRASAQVEIAPEPPKEIKVEPHDMKVILSWEAPDFDITGNEITEEISYYIFRSQTSSIYLAPSLNDTPISETVYVDENVENYQRYFYVIRSTFGGKIMSSDSSEATGEPYDDTIPSAPVNLKSFPSKVGIQLIWDKNIEVDVIGYNVYRRADNQESFVKINAKPVEKPSFVDPFVDNRSKYFYYVTAIDAARKPNESLPSAVVESKPVRM